MRILKDESFHFAPPRFARKIPGDVSAAWREELPYILSNSSWKKRTSW
jgi:hypothetical protein